MYKRIFIFFTAIVLNCCGNAQSKSIPTSLSATKFAEQLKTGNIIQLLDVRRPGEFKNGHKENAINAGIVDC